MLTIQRHGVGPATNAKQMVDRINVVHVVAIANYLPQVGGADAHQTIILLAAKSQTGDCQKWINRVEDVGRHKIVRLNVEGRETNAVIGEGVDIPAGTDRISFAPEGINVYANDWRVSAKGDAA